MNFSQGCHFDLSGDGDVVVTDLASARRIELSSEGAKALIAQSKGWRWRHLPRLRRAATTALARVRRSVDFGTHWIARGWDVQFPLQRVSRPFTFVDVGAARDQKLRESHKSYAAQRPFPERPPLSLDDGIAMNDTLPRDIPYSDLIRARRSQRRFGDAPIPFDDFEAAVTAGFRRLRKACEARTETDNLSISYGVAFEIIIVAMNVDGLAPGVYWYDLATNRLKKIRIFDDASPLNRDDICQINYGLPCALSAQMCAFVMIDYEKYAWLYRHEKGLLNVFFELGRVMQDFLAYATRRNISGVCTPAIHESRFARAVLCTPHLQPGYTAIMGRA